MDSDRTNETAPSQKGSSSLDQRSSISSELLSSCPPALVEAFTHNRPLTETEMFQSKQAEADLLMQNTSEINSSMETSENQGEVQETNPLSRRLDICFRLEAPIRRIPFDILREIAAHSLPSHPVPTFERFNATFTQVCSAWREAALSSPQLWTTLFTKIGTLEAMDETRTIEWLKRAKGLPITLYFDFIRHTPREPTTAFFRAISPHLAHLSHLGIRSVGIAHLHWLLDMPLDWKASKLQQLDIRNYRDTVPRSHGPPPLSRTPPSLTRLTLEMVPHDPDSITNFVQWSQLTYLRLSGPVELRKWIYIMNLSTNLQSAFFSLCVDTSIASPPPGSLIHPCLEKLALQLTTSCSHISMGDIMQIIQLPKIKVLDIFRTASSDSDEHYLGSRATFRTTTPDAGFSGGTFQDFEHLTALSIDCTHDDDIEPLLLKARNLRRLSVDMVHGFAYDLIRELSHRNDSLEHLLSPLLSFLSIRCSRRLMSQHKTALIDLIRSRQPTDGSLLANPLQNVIINIREMYAKYAIPEFTEHAVKCKKIGLGFEIHDWTSGHNHTSDIVPRLKSFDDVDK